MILASITAEQKTALLATDFPTTPAEAVVNQHGLRQAMIKLPAERRKELRQNRADSQPLIMAGREARLGVIKQLEAPTLDRQVLVTERSSGLKRSNVGAVEC